MLNDEYTLKAMNFDKELPIENSNMRTELFNNTVFLPHPIIALIAQSRGTFDAIRVYRNNEIFIFLDANLVDAVSILINVYNITEYPSLVIDGETHLGFMDYQELKRILMKMIVVFRIGHRRGIKGDFNPYWISVKGFLGWHHQRAG